MYIPDSRGFLFPLGRGVIKNTTREVKDGCRVGEGCMHLLPATDEIYS